MRFVPIKTKDQQTDLMLHRTRQLSVRQRTMLSTPRTYGRTRHISAKGRNGTAELLKVIANAADDRIPPVA
jgi:transposase